jgi:nitrogen fixation protein FixH
MNPRARSSIQAVVGVVAALLLGTACGDDKSASTEPKPAAAAGKPLEITFRTLASPTSGNNKVEAVVKQADGTPVADATVSVTFRMPAMPSMNMPEMHTTAPLTSQGDGRYTGTGELMMAGSWNVTVNVSRNGEQVGSSRFTLLAK